jgi:hypothetical protein
MDELRKGLGGLLPHALGGAVGRDQVGVLRLERAQLALERVVLLVPDLGRVLLVVELLVPADLRPQEVDAGRGLVAVRGLAGGLNSRAPG